MVEMENDQNFATRQEDVEQWILYMDGATNENGSGASMMLISLEEHKIHCALHFGFLVSNNEALIVGLCLENELQAHNMKMYSDSQLVVTQVNDI